MAPPQVANLEGVSGLAERLEFGFVVVRFGWIRRLGYVCVHVTLVVCPNISTSLQYCILDLISSHLGTVEFPADPECGRTPVVHVRHCSGVEPGRRHQAKIRRRH